MLLRQKPMCSKLYIAVKDAEINDYLQMVGFIPKYYDNYTITNAKEDLYADNVSYSDGGYNAEVIYYNQNDIEFPQYPINRL